MILVDVGPAMGDMTPTVRHAISTFVTGKVKAPRYRSLPTMLTRSMPQLRSILREIKHAVHSLSFKPRVHGSRREGLSEAPMHCVVSCNPRSDCAHLQGQFLPLKQMMMVLQMVHKPAFEAQLFYFGTTGTLASLSVVRHEWNCRLHFEA